MVNNLLLKRWHKWVLLLLLLVCSVVGSRYLVRGDVYFHTDIARDFLLIDEIVSQHKLTLIGPKSGGIPGLFHGPLWLYLMIPAFVVADGNPSGVGIYWFLLVVLYNLIVFLVMRRLFDFNTGLLTVTLTASQSIFYPYNMLNPFGAYLLAPIFIYLFFQLLSKPNRWRSFMTMLVMGLMFQFQMAFAGPLVVVSLYLIYRVKIVMIQKKHMVLMILGLCLPLASFIGFDIRHNWLQLRSLMDYFTTSNEGVKWSKFLLHRFEQMLVHGLSMTPGNTLGSVMTLVGFGMVWYYLIKNRYQAKQIQRFLSVVFWLYGGYWLVALLFRGELWSYYYGPFISLMAMALVVGLVQVMGSRLTWGFIIGLVVTNLYAATPTYAEMDDFVGENELSWRFYQQMSKDIAVKTSGRDFGFFAYTPDQYGYQPRYAIQWLQKSHNGTVFGYQKKALTLLVIAPAPNNKPELDGVWWTQEQVRIEKSPTEIVRYGNGYRVEYYNLTEAEQGIQTDPNLIDDLVFR